mmetsp:Transcript_51895/g.134122  ORF Transcript_51895/g.134122 Transcript_51895/m.134122 type:complete len:91 (-) Transcript_51895:249-521(-)
MAPNIGRTSPPSSALGNAFSASAEVGTSADAAPAGAGEARGQPSPSGIPSAAGGVGSSGILKVCFLAHGLRAFWLLKHDQSYGGQYDVST